MKASVFPYIALIAGAAVLAKEKSSNPDKVDQLFPEQNPSSTLGSPSASKPDVKQWEVYPIDLEHARPFPEPKPKTVTDMAGVKFKPHLHVSEGCFSFPAVNAAGKTNEGLTIEDGMADIKCKGPKYGSQTFGRGTWHRDRWAMMFAWHFPTYNRKYENYDWEHVVVWLRNPAGENQTLEAVSIWDDVQRVYTKAVPPAREFMAGSSVKVELGKDGLRRKLRLSRLDSQFQPQLIMWDQLPEKARHALDTVVWNQMPMPLSDSRFTLALENAWPFAPAPLPDDSA
ncbi:unnamed protein product [Hyaloperonospora brassicae]|uniref:Nep1-like protein n=1 Tax=Hyaloperonospora brassicae TaxID=162125 RepID=A0AAV0SY64_HYABA|nr:unnamed protein product [Hyaloperonospora brassicae]CAI5708944.1 unnamed protein product [Hyaloperonospora brassicae]